MHIPTQDEFPNSRSWLEIPPYEGYTQASIFVHVPNRALYQTTLFGYQDDQSESGTYTFQADQSGVGTSHVF